MCFDKSGSRRQTVFSVLNRSRPLAAGAAFVEGVCGSEDEAFRPVVSLPGLTRAFGLSLSKKPKQVRNVSEFTELGI